MILLNYILFCFCSMVSDLDVRYVHANKYKNNPNWHTQQGEMTVIQCSCRA